MPSPGNDFRAAQVKKLVNLSHGKFYRARLDDADRLLFSLVRHGDEVCALMLEVIANHDYDKSRFLRGAAIDESRIPTSTPTRRSAKPAGALPAPGADGDSSARQADLLRRHAGGDLSPAAPLIVVGSAGSGKTALTLEKLKHAEGEVLYVTHSSYLAQSARDLYYANGFEHSGQEAVFLSYREFVESIRVPPGREATWRDFAGWFARMRQTFREFDGHQVFEEIRGVLAAGAGGVLSRADYLALGVRQSIFPVDLRDKALRPVREVSRLARRGEALRPQSRRPGLAGAGGAALRLRRHRRGAGHHHRATGAGPQTLKKPGHFLLCGDSNQIVHPNFFSWSQVKSLFWKDPKLAERQELRVLTANFRNGLEATRVANQLLKIKHRRFGSIDRESNFLVQAVGGDAGQVALMPDKDATKRELDQKIRQSTQFAVLVMRDEDKAEARKHFATPLLFSIHEAKGLEYENIVLYRFISDHRAEFSEIVDGVAGRPRRRYARLPAGEGQERQVARGLQVLRQCPLRGADTRDQECLRDRVGHRPSAVRAARDESRPGQGRSPAIDPRRLAEGSAQARTAGQAGTGREAIRRTILKQTPVPWPVFGEEKSSSCWSRCSASRSPAPR
jgi:hypothetical protein